MMIDSIGHCVSLAHWLHRQAPGATLHRTEDAVMVWTGMLWPFGNQAIWITPAKDDAEIESRLKTTVEYMAPKGGMYLITVCHQLIRPTDLFAKHNFHPAMEVIGMVADALEPPSREITGCDVRAARSDEEFEAMCHINAIAYGVPLEWASDMSRKLQFRSGDLFASLVWVNDSPVASAEAIVAGDTLYVAFVATLPEYQRRGFAELAIRHVLDQAKEATGLTRTALHATPAGRPVYARMGYRDTVPFTMYVNGPAV